jgi:hypothetical protein
MKTMNNFFDATRNLFKQDDSALAVRALILLSLADLPLTANLNRHEAVSQTMGLTRGRRGSGLNDRG